MDLTTLLFVMPAFSLVVRCLFYFLLFHSRLFDILMRPLALCALSPLLMVATQQQKRANGVMAIIRYK